MRNAAALFVPVLLLAACATPQDLPAVRYLDAEYRGATAPRLSEGEFHRQAELWRDAVVDSGACRLPRDQVVSAAFAARSELTAMREHAEGNTSGVIGGVLTDLVMSATIGGGRASPDRGRCNRLARWLPTVQARRDQAGDWSVLENLLKGGGRP
jgi:hypothetical protein